MVAAVVCVCDGRVLRYAFIALELVAKAAGGTKWLVPAGRGGDDLVAKAALHIRLQRQLPRGAATGSRSLTRSAQNCQRMRASGRAHHSGQIQPRADRHGHLSQPSDATSSDPNYASIERPALAADGAAFRGDEKLPDGMEQWPVIGRGPRKIMASWRGLRAAA